jgi:hypothetical protein
VVAAGVHRGERREGKEVRASTQRGLVFTAAPRSGPRIRSRGARRYVPASAGKLIGRALGLRGR